MKIKHLLGFVLAMGIAAPVAADFSVELLLGSHNQKFEESTGSSDSEREFGLGIRGVWQLNPHVAFEAAYQNYGSVEDQEVNATDPLNIYASSAKLDASSLNFGFKGILPVDDRLSLNIRLGLAFLNLDAKVEVSDGTDYSRVTLDQWGQGLYAGLGVEYQLAEQFYTGLSYSYTKAGVSDVSISDGTDTENLDIDYVVNSVQLYLGYRF